MNDDFLLNDVPAQSSKSLNDLDSLFENLTNDINSFNRYVDDVNNQKKENTVEERELFEEKQKLQKSKYEFEEYVKTKQAEYDKKIGQIDEYLSIQRQNLLKAEAEFKSNMDNSLKEIDISKKELEIEQEKFRQEKEQFESYKSIELERLKHSQEIFESDKNQFEKYKEVANKKLELDNKNLEQKFDKFKELLNQFNSKFKPIIKDEEV